MDVHSGISLPRLLNLKWKISQFKYRKYKNSQSLKFLILKNALHYQTRIKYIIKINLDVKSKEVVLK